MAHKLPPYAFSILYLSTSSTSHLIVLSPYVRLKDSVLCFQHCRQFTRDE